MIDEVVDHIAQMHGIQHSEAEIHGELQPRLSGRGFNPVAVLKQQDAETIEARVLQRKAVLGLVHAEAARAAGGQGIFLSRAVRRAAGASGEKNKVVQNLAARETFFLQKLEILHQIADGKIRRVALAVVAKFFPGLESGNIRHRQLLAAVTATLEHGPNQVFMLPGESAEQNRDTTTLIGCESPLDRTMEMRGLVESRNLAQASALCF